MQPAIIPKPWHTARWHACHFVCVCVCVRPADARLIYSISHLPDGGLNEYPGNASVTSVVVTINSFMLSAAAAGHAVARIDWSRSPRSGRTGAHIRDHKVDSMPMRNEDTGYTGWPRNCYSIPSYRHHTVLIARQWGYRYFVKFESKRSITIL